MKICILAPRNIALSASVSKLSAPAHQMVQTLSPVETSFILPHAPALPKILSPHHISQVLLFDVSQLQ